MKFDGFFVLKLRNLLEFARLFARTTQLSVLVMQTHVCFGPAELAARAGCFVARGQVGAKVGGASD